MTTAFCLVVPPAFAAPIHWRSRAVEYVVNGKPLKEVLRDFAASQGITVSISPDVEGTVEGTFRLTPAEFLQVLSLSYGFVWYYNGVVLHIVSAKGIRSALVKLNTAQVAQLREVVSRMRLEEARFPIVYDERENTALISGPQEYVDTIRELAQHLEDRTGRSTRAQVRVFRLENAWAADRGQGEQRIPGVASLLQEAYRDGRPPAAAGLKLSPSLDSLLHGSGTRPDRVAPMLGIAGVPPGDAGNGRGGLLGDMLSGTPPAKTGADAAAAGPRGERGGDGGEEGERLPVITADPINNAVIVRDLPERMEGHAALIRSFDQRAPMVEIEVHILDIEERALEEIGIDWTASGSHFDARTGNGRRPSPSYDSGPPSPDFPLPAGGLLTAVVGNSGRYLLARVAALSEKGRANVSARPKVATLNNVSALMDDQKTFYVRVSGFQSAQLYNVTAGTSFKVTPMTTRDASGAYRIKLDVEIRDGKIGQEEVEGLPIVSTSTLTTQAFVAQGESLLLAGYSREERTRGTVGVPWLSSLPLIGGLFQQKRDNDIRRERLFLVSPRLIGVTD